MSQSCANTTAAMNSQIETHVRGLRRRLDSGADCGRSSECHYRFRAQGTL
ncbi:MAG: hypothetical protein K0S70_2691 [Microbacterium sp.]|nr:hypothetical protein [Microbacterium sp.]